MYQVEGIDGLLTEIEGFDWCFRKADLCGLTPAKGDEIETGGVVYRVLPIGKLPCWQFLDTESVTILVRTKRVE